MTAVGQTWVRRPRCQGRKQTQCWMWQEVTIAETAREDPSKQNTTPCRLTSYVRRSSWRGGGLLFFTVPGCRLLTLRLVGGDGLEYEFSRATWIDK